MIHYFFFLTGTKAARSWSDPGPCWCCYFCCGGRIFMSMYGLIIEPMYGPKKRDHVWPPCNFEEIHSSFLLFQKTTHVWYESPFVRRGHTQFLNNSVRFKLLDQVVWVPLLVSFWGVTPSIFLRALLSGVVRKSIDMVMKTPIFSFGIIWKVIP